MFIILSLIAVEKKKKKWEAPTLARFMGAL
jgi:hypothetical protein